MKRLAYLPTALLLWLALPAAGQVSGGADVVDRVVAIVGDSAILQTQVEEEIQRMRLQGAAVPERGVPAYQDFFRNVLDTWINRVLVLQAAANDTLISVDDADVDALVTDRIEQLAEQFNGQPALQQALAAEGLTLAGYRDILRNEARQEQIQQMFLQVRLRDAPPAQVSEDEMRARFESASEQLQQRPRLITFRQVVLRPDAESVAVEAARAEADSLLQLIREGSDFAELAERHSDDQGSAAMGGDVGWFRRGRMVRAFEDAAFALLDGQVSDVVETEYGFHIIKVERSRAGERQARHILIMPERTEADLERTQATARDVLERARGGESMKELAEEFADPAAPDSLTLAFEQLGELPPAYSALRTAAAGDLVGPLTYEAGPGESRVAVIRVEEVREAGAYTFEDVRAQLASQLQQEKQRERLLAQLRANTYIDIRM